MDLKNARVGLTVAKQLDHYLRLAYVEVVLFASEQFEMSLLARFGLGRKVIVMCIVVFVIILLTSITLLPTRILFIDGTSSVSIV